MSTNWNPANDRQWDKATLEVLLALFHSGNRSLDEKPINLYLFKDTPRCFSMISGS